MITRRSLLRGAALVPLAGLAGCAVVRPTGVPTPLPSPELTPSPARDAVVAVHEALSQALSAPWDADQAQLDTLGWALGVSLEQAEALALTLPSPAPSTPTPAATPAPSPLPDLKKTLTGARKHYLAAASDPTSASGLLWASMAAWTSAVTAALDLPAPTLGTVRHRAEPAPGSPTEVVADAVAAAAETAYGLEVAAGTPGLPADANRRLATLAVGWRRWIDRLSADLKDAAPTVAPFYALPRPATPDQAVTTAGRLLAALLPHLGRAVAFAEPPLVTTFVTALVDAATEAPRWGARVDRWPGLP